MKGKLVDHGNSSAENLVNPETRNKQITFLSQADREMIRESVEGYLADNYTEAEHRDQAGLPLYAVSPHWQVFADSLALLGLTFPSELGGMGGGAHEQAMILELFGKHLVLEPYLSAVGIGGCALMATSHPDVKRVIDGSLRVAFAHGEPTSRYDPRQVSTIARAINSDYLLDGEKTLVLDACSATHLLISAKLIDAPNSSGIGLFLVPRETCGITYLDYRTISARAASNVQFKEARVAKSALLASGQEGIELLERLLDHGALMVCAEALGIMDRLLHDTVEYTKQRTQFGNPISSFQVLQHRMADMLIAKEHSSSIVNAALKRLEGAPDERMLWISATKVFVGKALRFVAQQAVQLHGGMGITDELFVGRLFKRATEIERQFGSVGYHLKRYDRILAGGTFASRRGGIVAADDPTEGSAHAKFRAEVRAFIYEKYPQAKRELNSRQAGMFAEPDLGLWWQNVLNERGWAAPSWPARYGGPGWDSIQRHIFAEECALANTPAYAKLGISLAAPALMKFGTEAQTQFFLPRILSGEIYFCQGFSEPSSGSDLASLRTRAVREGDNYVVNGSKIWTTHAHFANWIFLLVRTSQDGRPQAGISFILVPLTTPGITIRPIISMSGEHEVNQVFFNDVVVPVGNRVGEENQGWSVTKYLLEFERSSEFAPGSFNLIMEAMRIAKTQPGDDGDSLWDDSEFRRRVLEHEINVVALDSTESRIAAALTTGANVGNVLAAVLKISGTDLLQRSTELCVEALGDLAFADQRRSLSVSSNVPPIGPKFAAKPVAKYLNTRAHSIMGGSSEILRNIIAATGCGLR